MCENLVNDDINYLSALEDNFCIELQEVDVTLEDFDEMLRFKQTDGNDGNEPGQ